MSKDSGIDQGDLEFIGEDNFLERGTDFIAPETSINLAQEEEKNWGKEHENIIGRQRLRLEKVLFKIALITIILLALLLLILIIVWFYHLVTPECIHWLDGKRLQLVERVLFASTLLSVAGKYFSKFNILERPKH